MPSQAVLELMVNLKDNASSGLSSLGGALKGVGMVAGGVALAGVAALGAAVVSGIGDAREAALLNAATAKTIETMGNAAGRSAEQIVDLASGLSDAAGKSLFGDDQIQSASNLLLTFGEIKGETFDLATALTVDLAQALGGAPRDQAMMLGKALNDPVKGMSALGKAGLTFTEEQKGMVAAMVEAGDMAGAQALIIEELNKQVGGQAAAAAAADGGWAQFNARMGEAKETLGAAVLPLLGMLVGVLNDNVIPIIEAGAVAFGDLVNYFTAVAEDGDTLNDFLGNLPASIQPVVQMIGELAVWLGDHLPAAIALILPLFTSDLPSGLQSTGATFTVLQETVASVMGAIQGVVSAVLPQIVAFWQANGDEIMAFVKTTWDTIQGIIQVAMQIIQAIIVPILAAIASFINAHGTEIQAILKATWDYISGTISTVLGLIQGLLKTVLLAINGDWAGAWEMLKKTSADFVQGILDTVTTVLGDLEGVFNDAVASIKATWAGLVSQAATIGKNIIDGIISGVQSAASALYSTLRSMASEALQAAKDAIFARSPSQAFADEVGAPIVEGIIQGIQQTAGSLLKTMSSLTGNLASGATGALDEMAQAIMSADMPDTFSIGEDILNGMIDGMKSAKRGLVTFIESTADTVEGALADAFKIGSPSQLMADVIGTPLIQGIAMGMANALPGLLGELQQVASDMLNALERATNAASKEVKQQIEDLKQTMEGMAELAEGVGASINKALAAGFSAEGSIDRQIAKNLDSMAKVSEKSRKFAETQLQTAMTMAAQFGDPATGAKYLKMRSDQIFELAKLQDSLNASTDADQRARIQQQIQLISAAQVAEQNAFAANDRGSESPQQKIIAQINALIASFAGTSMSDAGIALLDRLAGMADQVRGQGGAFATPVFAPVTGPSGPVDSRGHQTTVININLPAGTTREVTDEVMRRLNTQVSGRRG